MLMDNIVVRALSRLFDLILLNILWVLFSLPLVTVGASTAALYSVMMKIVANEEGYIIRGFLNAFRRNLKQSTVVWLMLLAAGAVLAADVMILGSFTGMPAKAGLVLLGAVAFIYLTELIFVFPLIARFENTTFRTIKNAVLIPFARLGFMLPVMFLTAASVFLTFLNQATIMAGAVLWSVIGGSLLAFANSFLLREMFRPFEKGREIEKETYAEER